MIRTDEILAEVRSSLNPVMQKLLGHHTRLNDVWEISMGSYMARSINFLNKTESPIEQILGLSLRHLVFINGEWMNGFSVLPQEELELDGRKIRLDFLILNPFNTKDIKIAVECDGHEFHEKTKEQAQRDKKRDRILVKHGYTVFHFTGSEIVNDPLKCSMEVIDTIWGFKHEEKVD